MAFAFPSWFRIGVLTAGRCRAPGGHFRARREGKGGLPIAKIGRHRLVISSEGGTR